MDPQNALTPMRQDCSSLSAGDGNHELSRQEQLNQGGRVGRAGHQHAESWQSMGSWVWGGGHRELGMESR